MYSANFDYHRARSLSDAQQLLAAHPGAKLLAGGHSLIPLMKLRLAARPPGTMRVPRAKSSRHDRSSCAASRGAATPFASAR